MRRSFFPLLLLLAGTLASSSQAQFLTSVVPNTAFPGDVLNVGIQGSGTQFDATSVQVDFGPGITVTSVQVNTADALTVGLVIDEQAALGFRTVSVTTNGEVLTLDEAFQVQEMGDGVLARLDIVPVDVLYLSDFDPAHPEDAPILFVISVTNDAQPRSQLTVVLESAGVTNGPLGKATKVFRDLGPFEVVTVNSNTFDTYEITASQALIDQALQTGIMPPDTYTYTLCVLDEQDQPLTCGEGENETTTPVTLEVISPGTEFSDTPEVLPSPHPLFQWFGEADAYSVYLYEVLPGQRTPEEVTTNRPHFIAEDLTAATLLYPNYADALEPGKTYAWQVLTTVATGDGTRDLISDMLWFTLDASDTDLAGGGTGGEGDLGGTTGGDAPPGTPVPARIEVAPFEIQLKGGEQFLFQASVFDTDGALMNVRPTWRVVPEEAGRIDDLGLFTASNRPMAAAVVASVGHLEEYAIVLVQWEPVQLNAQYFFNRLFGVN